MFSLFRTLSLRYLGMRWSLNALVVVSIGLGVSVWVATTALYQSLEESVLVSLNPLAGVADLQVSNGEAGVPRDLEERLAAVPGVREARPMVIEGVRVIDGGGKRHAATLVSGEVPSAGAGGPALPDVTVSWYALKDVAEALKAGGTPVVVGRGLEAVLPPGPAAFEVLHGGVTHKVVSVGTVDASGPIAALGGNVVLMPCDPAAVVAGHPGRVSRFDLVLDPGADRARVTADVAALVKAARAGDVATPEAEDGRVREALAPLKVGSLIVSAGALVVGMFLVYNTLSVSVAERRHDIGVMRSLGATRGQVSGLFLGEAVVLGLLGTLVGIPFGLGLARALLGPIGRVVVESLGTIPMHMPALAALGSSLLGAVGAGVATSVVASLVPALGAAREEPADAVRRVPPSSRLSARAVQLATCLLLAGLGVALVGMRDHLPKDGPALRRGVAFAGVGCVFLAAFLAIALFAAVCARLLRPVAQRLFPVEGRLAADNLVRAPGRTGLVIAALAACVALMAHTAGVTRSNETAVMGWLERAVTADLIITSGGPVSATGQTAAMKESVGRDLLAMLPAGSQAVAISWHYLRWERGGRDEDAVVAAVDGGTYAEANRARGMGPARIALFTRLAAEPRTAVMSDNFGALYGVAVGDTVTLRGEDGPVPLTVIGSVEDYSAPRGLLLVERAHYVAELRGGKPPPVDIYDVYLPAGTDAAGVERARETVARSELAAEHSLVPLTGAEVRQSVIDMIRRLYSLGYLQEIVVGVVAGLGVVAALLISVIQRRRELGLLRAVGATQGQVLRTVLFEALLMGVIGSLLGVLFGLLLEWYAVKVILLEESGFRFPLTVPWREAGVIAALAVTVATLAGLLPALRAVRLRIADAIAYE